jgi:cytosine/adenosine deaminase-related metal-dependent hydrolase
MSGDARTLKARYVFPVEGPPIADGSVTIEDGRIVRVDPPETSPTPDVDLGNAAITPGFVNAHTHLELEPLPPLGEGPEDEVDWLERIVARRRAGTAGDPLLTVERNLQEATRHGTTALADITTAGLSWDLVAAAPVRAVVFTELIGLNRIRGLQTSEEAFSWLARLPETDATSKTRAGLSPHAPYSTAGWLYHRAAMARLPLATHLAELPEELELLASKTGRLREFLEGLGAWDEGWEPVGDRPADYLRRGDLRQSDWIVAHGTYLDPSDFWQFRPAAAPEGQRVGVAYCPRTTARFGHGPHPYQAMLERGIVVGLGTDSLASTPTLSVLDEARFLGKNEPNLRGDLLLTMATLFGAWLMRIEDVTGSLKPGKSADLAVVGLPDRDESDPYSLIFDSEESVLATIFEGDFVFDNAM